MFLSRIFKLPFALLVCALAACLRTVADEPVDMAVVADFRSKRDCIPDPPDSACILL